MSLYFQSEKTIFFLIFIGSLLLCFSNIWGYPIYILDEAKNAEAAREMLETGKWFEPMFNGELRTDKPPLHYFFMALAYKLFGVSAFSARFFSALFGAFTISSTYYYIQKFENRRLALLTVLVLCSSVFFIQEFHLAVPDPYLIFFITFGLLNFYAYYLKKNYINWLYFCVSIGLGILAKGPVALALPALIAFIFVITNKDFKWKDFLIYQPVLGMVIVLAIALPWFFFAHQLTEGKFTEGFFLEHNLQRFGGEMEGHGGRFFMIWIFVLLGLLPFSFFIIQGFISSWNGRKTSDFVRFSLIVSIVFIGFFGISGTILPNYPMPSYPFLAFLIAVYLNDILIAKEKLKGFKISLYILLIISALLPIAGYIALTYIEKQLIVVNYVSFSLLIVTLGSIVSLIYFKRKSIRGSIISLGISWMLMIYVLFFWVYPKLTEQSPVSMALEKIDKNHPMILYKGFDSAFPINFEKTFPLTESKEDVFRFLKENKNGYVVTKEKFYKSDWDGEKTDTILLQKSLFESHSTIIFKLK